MDNKELLRIIDKAGEEGAGHLDLSGKQLTMLPKEIGRLRNLKILDLDGNQLTVLPLELFELTNLTHLRLSDNHLASLPPEIGQLANLQVLYAYKNKLKTIPGEIGQLDQLDQLVLPFNEISALPKEISQLNRLLYLSVYFNSLSDFILEITRLVNLRTLEIHGNRITKLPGEFAELVNLEDLTIGSNQLTSLPKEILKLTKLKRLKIYQMSLSSCPPEIFQLSNLENLDVSYNKLTSLGPEINRLSGLEVLQLQSNNFSVFPSEILGLTNLKILNLSKNPMTALPSELGRLAHLETLKLDNTPISSPPPEIVEQGTQAILLYLREQLQGGRKQWVSKLLVVGEGGVGKTSLLRALRGEPFQTEESTTHGIDIQPLMLSHPDIDKVSMQLNTWDFGGQDIYHATHQFFLTNRSLFVLAWNARLGFEQGKLYYWLDTIKARAPESPVLIVATYIDEREANIPLAELQRKYPQVIGHCEISSKTGAGIENLKAAITNAAATLPLMGEVWPANWLNAANAIRSSQENHITPKQLYDLMAEHNVERDKVPILAQWLHELGDLLYFKDDDELNDIVILNPQWVTQSISRVLESEDVINNLGLFARQHMNALWSDIDPPMREHFLRLMEKFDLSYRTLENKDISLVVERLSFEPPKYEDTWDAVKHSGNCNEISMKFELDTTMPAGVPTWFIARTHRFTTRNHWRYGALFADGPEQKHLGLIQAFPHDRFIKLTARGSIPHSFFALLVDGLEVTLRRFPGLKINRKIPCPGHEGEACTHEFELTNLQRAIERKPPVLEIQCPVSFENVPVPGLLFGLPWSMTNEIIVEQYKVILSRIDDLSGEMKEMIELTQREFTKIFHREQAKIESYCPNIFVLRPSDSTGWLRNIFGQKMEMQLFCQAPGQWHAAEAGGLYEINQPAEWLQTMAPYLSRMFSVLKYAMPLLGPWVGVLSPEHYEKMFKNDIKLMEELVKKLPDMKGIKYGSFIDPDRSVTFIDSHTERLEGAALRALRKLLDEKDPDQVWGGLKRILTPEGHYLWLCQHHAIEYAR